MGTVPIILRMSQFTDGDKRKNCIYLIFEEGKYTFKFFLIPVQVKIGVQIFTNIGEQCILKQNCIGYIWNLHNLRDSYEKQSKAYRYHKKILHSKGDITT